MPQFSSKAWFSLNEHKLLVLDDPSWSRAPSEKSPSIYAPDFFLKDSWCWLVCDDFKQIDLPEKPQADGPIIDPSREWVEHVREDQFQVMFNDLMELLAYQDLQKGVPYSYCLLDPIDFDPYQHILKGMKVPPEMFHYGYLLEGEGLFGLTPETLFELKDGVVKTMALAGTRDPRTGEFTAKDQVEHRHVVEDIGNLLANFGRITIGKTVVRKLSWLDHLCTPIECQLDDDISFESLVELLHPTPALGVYPRNKTGREWLERYQRMHDRKHFGAPFGVRYPNGDAHCVVAIRNIQFNQDRTEICAGCGVVSNSVYQKEWQELLLKIQSVRTQWGIW